jgi:hypothetical protein
MIDNMRCILISYRSNQTCGMLRTIPRSNNTAGVMAIALGATKATSLTETGMLESAVTAGAPGL